MRHVSHTRIPGVMYSREGAGFTEFLQVEQRCRSSGSAVPCRARASQRVPPRKPTGTRACGGYGPRRQQRWPASAQNKARLTAAEAHAQEMARLIGVLRTREQEGEGSRFDRLRAEQELRDARQAVTSAAVGVAEARADLAGHVAGRCRRSTRVADAARRAAPHHAAGHADQPCDVLARRTARAAAVGRARHARGRGRAHGAVASPDPLRRPQACRQRRGGARTAASSASASRCRCSIRVAVSPRVGRRARARGSGACRHRTRRSGARSLGASEALTLRQDALAQDEASAAEDLTRIAEVAYREGDVGILELLDAVRTASRARTAHHRPDSWTRASRRLPWNAQWETSCGPEDILWILLACMAVSAACSRDVPAPAPAPGRSRIPSASTRWTDKTELFAEYPALTVGETSRFAIHLTRLEGFKAVTEGQVEVQLRGGSAPPEVFRVDAPRGRASSAWT